jgi:rsbT co-antagonist protein RsbR
MERKAGMETGLEFVANARRQLIRLIALTIVASSCAALLLIAILIIITGNVAGLAPYAGVVALGITASFTTLALLKRRVLWQAILPIVIGMMVGLITSVFLIPEQTFVALPFLTVPIVLVTLGRHRLSILLTLVSSVVAGAGLAWFAPSVEVEQVIIGDALPLVSGIGFVTLLVIIWLLSDRLLAISDAAVALADKRAAEAENARQRAEEAQSTIAQQYAEQQRLLDLVSVLETPVIAIAEGVLLAPIVGHLDSRRAGQLTKRLLDAVYAQRARAVIIDIAGVPLVDTQVAQLLIRTAQSIRLLGSHVALTGISSETAMTLSSLGMRLEEMQTMRNPQEAIQMVTAGAINRLR